MNRKAFGRSATPTTWRLLWVGCAVITLLVSAVPSRAQQPPAAVAEVPTFDILEFVVEGNTVLATEDIERAVYPFLGLGKVFGDVEAAQAALQKAFNSRGYGTVLVDVPEQRADTGVIVLRVLEGRISRTRVLGARYYSQGYILSKVTGVLEGEVPHFPTLQAQLGSVNRTADRRVAPVLRPGREPGTTEVDLTVEDRLPLHGSVEINNRGGANTSPTRLQAALRYDNLWQRDHSLGVQVQTSPEKPSEAKVLSASYSLPMGEVGQDTLILSYTRSDSQVPTGLAGSTVFGKGNIWGLRRNFTLELKDGEFHLLTLGTEYKDFQETIEAGDEQGFKTPIAYLPFSLNYLGLLDDARGRWQMGAGLVVGLRGLASHESDFANKRSGATGGFSVLKLDLTREHKLPWWGSQLKLRLDAQITGQPLISNEQFVVGGVDSVRGYLDSAAVGDIGLRGAVEWRSRDFAAAPGTGLLPAWVKGLTGHVFLEGAATQLRQPLPDQKWRFRLAGTGFGLRARAQPGLSLSLDLAWPLVTLGETRAGETRLHASGVFEF